MKVNLKEVITIDWETFYSQSFSLRSKELNTSEYIRSPEFKAHCCTIKIGEGKTKCFPASKLKAEFAKIDWSKYDLLAHNTCFDAAILLWHYGHKPRRYFDTLSMTRGLHAEMTRAGLDAIARYYGIGAKHATYLTPTKGLRDLTPALYATLAEGCVIDTDLCFEIFKKQIEVYPEDEIVLIDMTVRMFVEPILHVDVARAERALEYEMNNRLRAIALSRVSEKTLNSSPQFAQALRDVDCEPPMKWSEKQGCMTTAFAMTDLNFLELLDHEDLRVIRLVEGRLAAKSTIIETRAYRLIKAGKDGRGLPVMLNYFGAKTGRWSGGGKMNLQNLNRQEYNEDGSPVPMTGELRKSIIAPPKHVVMVCDSAQIEARTLAWFAGQEDLLEQFRNKEDVYSLFASEVYGVKVTKKDKEMRFVGKVSILGLGYGMGAVKYRMTLARGSMGPPVHIDASFAKKTVNTYRKKNHMIPKAWKEAEQVLLAMTRGESGSWNCLEYDPETIWLPNGMGLHYPELRVVHDSETGRMSGFEYKANGCPKKIYSALGIENICQALARVIVGVQMIETQKYFDTLKLRKGEIARIASMSHDEIISVVPERLAEKIMEQQVNIMRVPPAWCADLPLDAESGYAHEYSK